MSSPTAWARSWRDSGGSANDSSATPSQGMSFDRLAPHYRWLEWILAGPKLQRCRTAFLPVITPPRHALLIGEGNGRFLVELLRAHPCVRVLCVDASARMLECARARLHAHQLN